MRSSHRFPVRLLAGTVLALALGALLASHAGESRPAQPPKALDLNTATAEELAKLPGVGPVIAARIVRHRENSGRFRSVDELLVVRGISRKKLAELKPYLKVEPGKPEKGKGKPPSE